jgi:hypothetical protein
MEEERKDDNEEVKKIEAEAHDTTNAAVELQGLMVNEPAMEQDQQYGINKAREFLQEDSLSGEKV